MFLKSSYILIILFSFREILFYVKIHNQYVFICFLIRINYFLAREWKKRQRMTFYVYVFIFKFVKICVWRDGYKQEILKMKI